MRIACEILVRNLQRGDRMGEIGINLRKEIGGRMD
jgi:hypothetical protein